jgi:branched-chain amino acid transport system permease protein
MLVLQLFVNSILAGANYALVALGFGLIFSTTRFLPFSQAVPYTLAAYSFHLFNIRLGFAFGVSILLALANAMLFGVVFDFCLLRRLRSRHASPSVLLLVSLGLVAAFQSMISILFGDQILATRGSLQVVIYSIMGARITNLQVATILSTIALFIFVWLLQHKTTWGKAQRALANDAELARALGVPTGIIYSGVLMTGAGIAGLAGVLAALDTDIVPMMGFHALVMGIAAAITGGIGSVTGSILGGMLIGLVQNFGVWKLPTHWQDSIVFLFLITFLLFRPQGMYGAPIRKARI